MNWLANLDVMVVPIYGKMSFASELDPSFDLYFVAGGGVVGTKRTLSDGADASAPGGSGTVVPAFNFGTGLRFYFSRLIALRMELRDYFYPDPGFKEDENTGAKQSQDGFTWNLHFQAGLQFSFGGE